MPDATPSVYELELFRLAAQQNAWRILTLLTTLEEPVSHEQVAQFVTAFDHGTPAAVETDATCTETILATIAELDEADVIDETASGLMRGPRFTDAFQMVPLS
ncbi:hypothetical protein [Halorubrum sp. PV6]|uniref:hypothetical protein n=1 Tax=Halorubrum sp. PV6 TaxID=634157 RepID=UPI0011987403|nr:hypothetical protein [Halorubrum sp. PV6]AZQ16103.1 hypothetical protein DOS48_14675 [Halorubrum sp. PV6]